MTTTAPSDNIIIALREVYKRFGEHEVLRGVSLEVPNGTSAVVMGPSGSGKSVMLRHIVKLLEPDQGEVWLNGQRIDQLTGNALNRARLNVGYLFQGGALFDSMTVYENLAFSLERHTRLSRSERDERIHETLSWVELDHMAEVFPGSLSGGQKKRIGLARAIILQPAVLLYDEPTAGLDPARARTVSELIVRLEQERGITSLTITHDVLCAEIIADTVHFLHKGRILARGTLETVHRSNHPAIETFFGGIPHL